MAEYEAVELLIAKIDSEGLDYAVENYPDVFADAGITETAADASIALANLRAAVTEAARGYPDLADRWQDMGG